MNAARQALAPILTAACATAVCATAAEASRPAVWSPHALIVDLPKLPRRYTCDQLWYKFRDVLAAIGARPDMKILPYGCDSSRATPAGLPPAYSPKVQLEFATPREVSGQSSRWADLRVVTKSVQLEPGTPAHLDSRDCELMKLIESTLLRKVGVEVADARLACAVPPSSKVPFSLTVSALVPVAEPASIAQSAAKPRPAESAMPGDASPRR